MMTGAQGAIETLSLEVHNVGTLVSLIATNMLDNQGHLSDPLFGIASHLERISDALGDLAEPDGK